MILKEITSEPVGLFKQTRDDSGIIKFKLGTNFIFGKKESEDATDSLNGIGKSLLLDFIDFALLSSFDKNRNKRLYEAKEFLLGYKIVLKFEVNNKIFTLKRDFDNPNSIEFGNQEELEKFEKISEVQRILCDLVFKNEDYKGIFENSWYRRLVAFFLKIHKSSDDRFSDPIKYLIGSSISELNTYHLFLLGIDNSLPFESNKIQKIVDEKVPILNNIESLIKETYGLKKISEVENKVDILKAEIKKLEVAVEQFQLAKQYKNAEEQADKITREIKDRVLKNYNDRSTISQYKESYEQDESQISTRKIKNLYKEFNEMLASGIKKELDEAIDFRKEIAKSRKLFLKKEIFRLENNITRRDSEIKSLEIDRKEIFNFLSVKEAIKDLTTAQNEINKKKDAISDLEGRTKLHSDLSKQIRELKAQLSELDVKVIEFVKDIQDKVSKFRSVFTEMYNNVYPKSKNTSIFTISEAESNSRKIDIDISFPAMRSEGKNQGRTLIYDLSILLYGIEDGRNLPRFLIHDGIFDGVDKAHFVAICNHLKEKVDEGLKFQYFLPINEEGTLNQKFGDVEELTTEKIEEEAIIILTPQKKLLGESW